MAGARRIEELDVYKLSDQVRLLVRPLLKRPIFKTDWDLRKQLKTSSESPCPNLAEGFSRFCPRDNARFVRVALGSLNELVVHMGRALAGEFISQVEHDKVVSVATRAIKATVGYVNYLDHAHVPGCPDPRDSRRRPRSPRRRKDEPKSKPRRRKNEPNEERNQERNKERNQESNDEP